MKFFYLLFSFYFIFTGYALAYLDPVSGTIILQILFAVLAAIITFFKKIKNFILSFFVKSKNKKEKS
jgi:hypothetical protein